MSFTVPSEHRRALEAMLDSGKLAQVSAVFATTSDLGNRNALIETLEHETGISDALLRNFLNVVVSMFMTRESIGMSVEKFIDEVCNQLDSSDLAKIEGRKFLSQILELEGVRNVAQTVSVTSSHERSYRGAKIISGLRTAFSDSDEFIGAVVTHELQITFSTDGDRSVISFGLDSDDLRELMEAVAAAMRRETVLDRQLVSLNEEEK